jgi:protein-tyrosine phosphatase
MISGELEPKQLLFVCTANICRSPIAEGLMSDRLRRAGMGGELEVGSAGTRAGKGNAPPPAAIELLRLRGVNLAAHRSRPVSVELVEASELIVVMEEEQRQSLFHLAPDALARVFLLSEFSGGHLDIEDPWGGTEADYARCIAGIDALLEAGWSRLIATAVGRDRE